MSLTGLKRNTIDKFYTKDNVVDLCLEMVKTHIIISPNNDLIIEPSAGNGSFINKLKTLSKNCIFYDIHPEHPDIIKQDFLEFPLNLTDTEIKTKFHTITSFKKIHVIGNPPFGRQSSLAIKFIKKSCDFCDSVSFILPKSFKKDSLKRVFPPQFHLIFEMDLPEKSFLVNGLEHNVDTIFQIWEKKDSCREIVEKLEPVNFMFTAQTENPDISFRRVGVYAGKIDKNPNKDKSIQSHYFIKFTNNKSVDENIELLKKVNFDHNNTTGPKSISKQELISQFNPLL